MSTTLHLDTHVVVWLYAGEQDRLPSALRRRMATDPLRVSPMVRLELTYLHEVGRITEPAHRILGELRASVGLSEDETSFADVLTAAEPFTWTRDPFDRIIAAQAVAAFADLATKDTTIRAHLPDRAVWD